MSSVETIFTKELVENHEYRVKDFKVHVWRQGNQSLALNSYFHLSRKLKTLNHVSRNNYPPQRICLYHSISMNAKKQEETYKKETANDTK